MPVSELINEMNSSDRCERILRQASSLVLRPSNPSPAHHAAASRAEDTASSTSAAVWIG